jgi:predicted N-acyltransferase
MTKQNCKSKSAQPFQVGDKVLCTFHPEWAHIVRAVTFIAKDADYGSGWRVCADDGYLHYKWRFAMPIVWVDSGWFTKIEGGK